MLLFSRRKIIFQKDGKEYEVNKIELKRLLESDNFELSVETGNKVGVLIDGKRIIRHSILELMRYKDFRRKYYREVRAKLSDKNKVLLDKEYKKYDGELKE